MTAAVIAQIGAAIRIVAAITPHAVFDAALLTRLVGDDRAEQQAAENAGGDSGAVTTATAMTAMMARPRAGTRARTAATMLDLSDRRHIRGGGRYA